MRSIPQILVRTSHHWKKATFDSRIGRTSGCVIVQQAPATNGFGRHKLV
jgi:hypothetical protein